MRTQPPRRSAILIGVAAAAGASIAGPAVRRLMMRNGILDDPNERSSHTTAVPRGGGWACLLGTVAGGTVGGALGYRIPRKTAAGAVALALVGFADDRWQVPAPPRLAAQAVVGLAVDVFAKHFPLGLMTVPTLVNVVNFMDGINGITSLTAASWGIVAVTVGTRLHNDHVLLLGASLAGAALGFLPHNLRRDRMFLGDVGSYLIGATVALTCLHPSLSWRARATLLTPLLPYLADTGTTLIRRAVRGESLTTAHREHLYQKLANDHGFGHLPVSLAYAALAAFLGMTAAIGLPRSAEDQSVPMQGDVAL